MAWVIKGGKAVWDEGVKLWNEAMDAGSDYSRKFFDDHDLRYDKRVGEQQRMKDLNIQARNYLPDIPEVKLSDYEGRPWVSSMSDRTAAGEVIYGINGIELPRQVYARGGQDYMFDPINKEGSLWASAETPVNQIMGLAEHLKGKTGLDPIYMPWRMAPSGGDFASTSGELMMGYASAAMDKGAKADLNKLIKTYIPDFKGVDDPAAVQQFRTLSDKKRKALKSQMDVGFRKEGGLGIGEARLAASDPYQIGRRDYELQNVGLIDTGRDIGTSSHPWYPYKIPGEGLGRLPSDGSPRVTELMDESATRYMGVDDRPNPWEGAPQDFIGAPEHVYNKQRKRMIPRAGKTGKGVKVNDYITDDWRKNWRGNTSAANPDDTDMRGLMMKPYGGILDDKMLKRLQAAGYNVGAGAGAALGLGALAGGSQEAEASFVGKLAKNVDLDMLFKAEADEAAGVGRDEIWKKYGWGRGADEQWRTEIDDSQAVFNPTVTDEVDPTTVRLAEEMYNKANKAFDDYSRSDEVKLAYRGGKDAVDRSMKKYEMLNQERQATREAFNEAKTPSTRPARTMGEAYDHPELYEAYPQLRDTAYADLGADDIRNRGAYRDPDKDFPSGRVRVNENMSDYQQLSTATHELGAHGVQGIEGFSPGGSPAQFSSFDLPYNNAKSIAEDIAERMTTKLGQKWGRIDTNPVLSPDEKKKQILALRDEDKKTWDAIAGLMEETGKHSMPDLRDHGSKQLDLADKLSPFNQYQRMPGESEARNVQRRLDWSPERRSNSGPWVTDENPWPEVKVGGNPNEMSPQQLSELGRKKPGEALYADEINAKLSQDRDNLERFQKMDRKDRMLDMLGLGPKVKMDPTIRSPQNPMTNAFTRGARTVQDSLQGSPASMIFPEDAVNYLERLSYGDKPTWGERFWAGMDVLPF